MRITAYFLYSTRCLYYLKKKDRVTLLSVITEASNELGGIVVKLLQFLSLRTELFSETEKLRLIHVFDQVKVQDIDVHKILIKDFSREDLSMLASVESTPFAAGSFSQVYLATHKNGDKLIIKIKRSNLNSKLWLDFVILKFFSWIFSLIYEQNLVNVSQTLTEFRKLTFQELDYRRELAYTEYFYQMYKENPAVLTPKPLAKLSNHRVLTQSYIDGIPLTKPLKSRFELGSNWEQPYIDQNIDFTQCMYALGMELLRQAAFFDYCYIDPHPGNIMILTGNRIAFIDFGLIIPAPTNRTNYLNIIRSIIPKVRDIDTKTLANELLSFGAPKLYQALKTLDSLSGTEDQSLCDSVSLIFQREINTRIDELEAIELGEKENFSQLLLLLIKYGRSLNVKVPSDFLGAFRGITLYNSYRSYLSADTHPTRIMYKQLISEVDTNKVKVGNNSKQMTADVAIETVLNSLEYLAETQPSKYQSVMKSMNTTLYA